MRLDYGVTRAPSQILFGAGQRRALGQIAKSIGHKVLICTDAVIGAQQSTKEIEADLQAHGVDLRVFRETEAELPLQQINECIAQYRDFAPDVVIGLGGGSSLDMAKLVALGLRFDQPLSDFYGEFKVPGPIVPMIAVPTTSGTGSEATPVAVLADPARATKVGISSPELIPLIAVCDPELTITCPRGLTAISGADALAHAMEAFAAVTRPATPEMASARVFVGKNSLSDEFALSAIRKIGAYLERAVNDGTDIEARGAVMMGATLAGLAFGSAGTGAAHAIQYPVGADTHTAHGLGIGVLMPYVMAFNLDHAPAAYAEIGRALGAATDADDDKTAAHKALDEVIRLFNAIGIPKTLTDLGVTEDKLKAMAKLSMSAARLVENNVRPLDEAGALSILENAFHGRIARS